VGVSRQNLRRRLRQHYALNAYGSTLRLTLGCLLAEQLGIQLRRVGSGTQLPFADGEPRLSQWMAEDAFDCWVAHERPWELEDALVSTLDLP
jgi:GIY-YIG catalytic domain